MCLDLLGVCVYGFFSLSQNRRFNMTHRLSVNLKCYLREARTFSIAHFFDQGQDLLKEHSPSGLGILLKDHLEAVVGKPLFLLLLNRNLRVAGQPGVCLPSEKPSSFGFFSLLTFPSSTFTAVLP